MFAQTNLTDQEIIDLLKQGDKHAFQLLYNKYVTVLLNYGLSITKDRELVKDCVQDLFMDLWHRSENLTGIRSFQAYLLISLKRMVIYRIKKQDKTAVRDSEYFATNTGEESFEANIIRTEMQLDKHHELHKRIAALPARQREVVFLRFYAEMSYAEIADLMELNYQGVRNLVYKAVSSLRGLLNKNTFELLLIMLLCLLR